MGFTGIMIHLMSKLAFCHEAVAVGAVPVIVMANCSHYCGQDGATRYGQILAGRFPPTCPSILEEKIIHVHVYMLLKRLCVCSILCLFYICIFQIKQASKWKR